MNIKEIEILFALETLGFNWLARDSHGELCTYKNKPEKLIDKWWDYRCWKLLEDIQDLFDNIEWKDTEPKNIEEMLFKYKQTMKEYYKGIKYERG